MNITHFSLEEQDQVAQFWSDIFTELGWKVNSGDGFDDIPAFLHFPQGFMLIVHEGNQIVGCGGVKPLTD